MSKMTPYKIEEYIEKVYPTVKEMVKAAGLTKEQWIEQAIKNPEKKFVRCENCKKWPCDNVETLKEPFPVFVKIWYEHGVRCAGFSPHLLQNKRHVK